jgi:hypothetical protein
MTIYVPYGEQWQAYYARRLTERKENVFFVLKNLFKSLTTVESVTFFDPTFLSIEYN